MMTCTITEGLTEDAVSARLHQGGNACHTWSQYLSRLLAKSQQLAYVRVEGINIGLTIG